MKEASIPRICTYKIPANADYAFFCKVSYFDIRKKTPKKTFRYCLKYYKITPNLYLS